MEKINFDSENIIWKNVAKQVVELFIDNIDERILFVFFVGKENKCFEIHYLGKSSILEYKDDEYEYEYDFVDEWSYLKIVIEENGKINIENGLHFLKDYDYNGSVNFIEKELDYFQLYNLVTQIKNMSNT